MTTPSDINLESTALDHERVVMETGRRSGFPIIVAVHSTVLGPALGGARIWSYGHWTDALTDALRLSEGMTLKNSAAGLDLGGGKAVICLPSGAAVSDEQKRDAVLDLADVVESLGGSYVTAEDVGSTAELMSVVATRTKHVVGLPAEEGGVGEPADATAAGVHASVLATLDAIFGSRDLAGRHLVISGLGQVGGRLARSLTVGGATLSVADVNPARKELADELGATWVDVDDALTLQADLLIPCGLGGVLSSEVIAKLNVKGVCGAANNQLAHVDQAAELVERGILWAPDFVVNAGGVIYLAMASEPGADAAAIEARVAKIGDTVAQVFTDAAANGTTTLDAALALARARLNA
ncbi:MAG TPA: Glu/Leu/Phe/Val dehydrogenase dimerization domain-containing protein [Terrimesophilobacter sp.]|nr:Glu/Leu/Phe/Val dehydrogenase dimerization domain-containing protein [Terrimesophilobacter sp.]HRQ00480.1 Glu/Leu/Phe/Val dehydrogenase dimerization domain-containing protein [Terrimesophilobacter sp.]